LTKIHRIVLPAIVFMLLLGLCFDKTGIEEGFTEKLFSAKKQTAAIGKVRIDGLRNTVRTLENFGERSTWQKQNEAIAWAMNQFQSLGIDSWIETYYYDGKTWPNLFAKIEGTCDPGQYILLLAHIDSRSDNLADGAPGANDNGSGIAVLLECARLLKEIPLRKSVQFCIFTNEESNAKGSQAFARKAKREGQAIQAVINLDVLGYNRAIAPVFWQAFSGHSSLKIKAKTILRYVQNFVSGLFAGDDVFVVAGRPVNADLVKTVAGDMRFVGSIKIKERIGEDCG
jgi:hypothetical protein